MIHPRITRIYGKLICLKTMRLFYVDLLFSHGTSWLCALDVIGLHKEQSTQAAKGCNSAAGVTNLGLPEVSVTGILNFL